VLHLYSGFYAELNLFFATGKRQDQHAVEKDRSPLTLENATAALHRKALTKTLKSSSGLSKGKGGGRWRMGWISDVLLPNGNMVL